MAVAQKVQLLTEEIAEFLASGPSREQLLKYRPSARVLERARHLLQKSKEGALSREEQWELDQFEFAETLMQLVKAHIRSRRKPPA